MYGANLATLYNTWFPRTKNLVFVSTTPVPNITTSLGRSYVGAVEYNKQALTSLQAAAAAHGTKLAVIDLWTAVIDYCGAYYTSCDLQIPANVHFEPKGQQFLGAKMAAGILAILGLPGGEATYVRHL